MEVPLYQCHVYVPILFGWFSWQLVSGEEALASRSSVSLPTFLTTAGPLSQVGEDLGQLVDDNVVGCQGRNLIAGRDKDIKEEVRIVSIHTVTEESRLHQCLPKFWRSVSIQNVRALIRVLDDTNVGSTGSNLNVSQYT